MLVIQKFKAKREGLIAKDPSFNHSLHFTNEGNSLKQRLDFQQSNLSINMKINNNKFSSSMLLPQDCVSSYSTNMISSKHTKSKLSKPSRAASNSDIKEKDFIVYFNIKNPKDYKDNFSGRITDRDRLKNLKKVQERVQQDKHKDAQSVKEAFGVIKENIQILKSKIKNENEQQRCVIQAKQIVQKSTIDNYINKKKDFYKKLDHFEYLRIMDDSKQKEAELNRLNHLIMSNSTLKTSKSAIKLK